MVPNFRETWLELSVVESNSSFFDQLERDKKKLLNRIRRIRGQLEGVERALEAEQECSAVLMTLAACRGSINGLMAEIIEGHILHHIVESEQHSHAERSQAAGELIDVVKSYMK